LPHRFPTDQATTAPQFPALAKSLRMATPPDHPGAAHAHRDRTRGELHQVAFEAGRHAPPAGGTPVLEPALPSLLVYREPPDRSDPGTARLIAGEACWIAARRDEADEAREIVRRLAQDGSAEHGAFLVIELWTASDSHARRF